jgi:hypothetical protein
VDALPTEPPPFEPETADDGASLWDGLPKNWWAGPTTETAPVAAATTTGTNWWGLLGDALKTSLNVVNRVVSPTSDAAALAAAQAQARAKSSATTWVVVGGLGLLAVGAVVLLGRGGKRRRRR